LKTKTAHDDPVWPSAAKSVCCRPPKRKTDADQRRRLALLFVSPKGEKTLSSKDLKT
jgi:hypothetical protein